MAFHQIETENVTNKYSCNLCGGTIVRIGKGVFGLRCILCRSTFIHRSLCHVFSRESIPQTSSIYELSVHGSFFKYLKKRYKNLTTSDYLESVPPGTIFDGKLIQNVETLTFFDESFDVVTSTEVFEHVVNDRKGFKEVYRVLKKEGKFIFTVPLDISKNTVERAFQREDKSIQHILEPEYHGDYLRSRVLAFRNYGIDIIDRLKEAGFETVKVINVTSQYKLMKSVVLCVK